MSDVAIWDRERAIAEVQRVMLACAEPMERPEAEMIVDALEVELTLRTRAIDAESRLEALENAIRNGQWKLAVALVPPYPAESRDRDD